MSVRLASLIWEGDERLGIVDPGDERIDVVDVSPDELWLAETGVDLGRAARAARKGSVAINDAKLLPPVPRPPKLLCVAANYLDHLKEGGGESHVEESRPQFFMKPPSTTLCGHGATFLMPSTLQALDYEAELAVVVGKRLYQASSRDEALDAVAGYSCFNDLSERRIKVDPRVDTRANTWFFDWLTGKWLDNSAPMGPWLVGADEIGDPQNLKLELTLNGDLMQSSSTGAMMNGVADIVWYASQVLTLEPGDVIATGTPAGVGSARGITLKPGDVTTVTIEGIGALTTHFAAAGQRCRT